MSDPLGGPADRDEENDAEENRAIASLLKRSMGDISLPKEGGGDVLRGVQRKLRQRSRGKFYGDGWSTTNTRMSYVLVAVVMLVIMGIAYFALGPVGIAPR
jgi:hypothetical protein